MKTSIEDFESSVDPRILERGREYFRDGLVDDLEELDENRWSTSVHGSETYEVEVRIKDGEIGDSSCDCPYDMGSVCKHEIAVYFAIRKKLGKNSEPVSGDQPDVAGKKRKGKTIADQIDGILKNISESEKTEIIKEFALANREFRSILLARHVVDGQTGEGKKDAYRQIIKESFRSGMDRHGFIDYWSGRKAARGAEELLRQADEMVEKGKMENAIPIYQVAIEETIPALQYADDSNGEFGGIIAWGFEKLMQCSVLLKDGNASWELLEYCLKESENKEYDGWTDWKWEFVRIASELVRNPEEKNLVFEKADELCEKRRNGNDFSDRYENEQAIEIKLKLIERFESCESIEKFVEKNLKYTSMRKRAIEESVLKKDFKLAKKLAVDGIELDTKRGWPGIVRDWQERSLQIAEKENNMDDIRLWTKKIFLEGREELELYDKLKKTYSPIDWKKEVANILNELKRSSERRFYSFHTLGEIFIREEMWEELLQMVKKNASAETLNGYYEYLGKRFPEEMMEMYEKVVRKELVQVSGRGTYQAVCAMLRKMKKMGGGERVGTMIEEFRELYKNRKALMEELNKA